MLMSHLSVLVGLTCVIEQLWFDIRGACPVCLRWQKGRMLFGVARYSFVLRMRAVQLCFQTPTP